MIFLGKKKCTGSSIKHSINTVYLKHKLHSTTMKTKKQHLLNLVRKFLIQSRPIMIILRQGGINNIANSRGLYSSTTRKTKSHLRMFLVIRTIQNVILMQSSNSLSLLKKTFVKSADIFFNN